MADNILENLSERLMLLTLTLRLLLVADLTLGEGAVNNGDGTLVSTELIRH